MKAYYGICVERGRLKAEFGPPMFRNSNARYPETLRIESAQLLITRRHNCLREENDDGAADNSQALQELEEAVLRVLCGDNKLDDFRVPYPPDATINLSYVTKNIAALEECVNSMKNGEPLSAEAEKVKFMFEPNKEMYRYTPLPPVSTPE